MRETLEDKTVELDLEIETVADKRILISGGTTGIGRATALLLAAHGAHVFTFGRHQRELDDAMRDVRAVSEHVYGTLGDTSRLEDVRRVFEEADEKLGRLDVFINNAALAAESTVESPVDAVEYVVRSNLLGYMHCAREALTRMRAQHCGHIVNVGSMSADVREEGSSIYVATKSGIQGFTEALRKEVNPLGVKVSLIEPGAVGTDMQDVTLPEQREKESRGEMLKAEDIARSIYFCLTQPPRCDVVVLQVRPHRQAI